jgi:hypothetical protein
LVTGPCRVGQERLTKTIAVRDEIRERIRQFVAEESDAFLYKT